MKIRYVAIDLDGTLLDDKREISHTNADAINRLPFLGVECIIVSSRHYHEIHGVLAKGGIGCIRYIVSRDGLYVYKDGIIIHEGTMLTMNNVERMLSITGAPDVFCSSNEADYMIYRSLNSYLRALKRINKNDTMIHMPLFFAKCKGIRVSKAIFFRGELNDTANYEQMQNYFTVHFVNGSAYDVIPKDVNKFIALQWLSKYEGIDLNQLVYLGDDYNDSECFENLPHSIVMGNAPKDLRRYSMMKDVKTNNEDGVTNVLIQLFGR